MLKTLRIKKLVVVERNKNKNKNRGGEKKKGKIRKMSEKGYRDEYKTRSRRAPFLDLKSAT